MSSNVPARELPRLSLGLSLLTATFVLPSAFGSEVDAAGVTFGLCALVILLVGTFIRRKQVFADISFVFLAVVFPVFLGLGIAFSPHLGDGAAHGPIGVIITSVLMLLYLAITANDFAEMRTERPARLVPITSGRFARPIESASGAQTQGIRVRAWANPLFAFTVLAAVTLAFVAPWTRIEGTIAHRIVAAALAGTLASCLLALYVGPILRGTRRTSGSAHPGSNGANPKRNWQIAVYVVLSMLTLTVYLILRSKGA